MKIAISAESTIDLTNELKKKFDVSVVPFSVILGDDVKPDGTFQVSEVFDFVEKTGVLPKTTALNEFEYKEYFESLLVDYDAVIHFALSSGITSSCSHAQNAADSLKNVFIVDSKSLSTGIALLAIYARELANKELPVEEVYKKVCEKVDKVRASFVIERLDYLFKGGRCSGMQYFGANILKIRPRIILKDGKMVNDRKYRGPMGSVVTKYCTDILSETVGYDTKMAFLTYTTATPEMIENAKTALKNAGFKKIYETPAGCTIASHCGANTLGIMFFNK